MKKRKILIIAPHCDDEVLGCGGAISHFKDLNYDVNVLILTNASKGDNQKYTTKEINKIRNECKSANKYLSVNRIFFLDFPAPNLDQYPISKIADSIKNYINKIEPLYVFIPFVGDAHIDHQIVYKASIVALRPINKFKVKNIFCYETLSETEWGDNLSRNIFVPNYFIPLKKSYLEKKINAMKKYKSQIKKPPHPRSEDGIFNLAKLRGLSIGTNFAESYMVVRITI